MNADLNADLKACVEQYKQKHNVANDPCAIFSEQADSIQEAARRAALSRDSNGRKHDHQRRLPNVVLENVARKLSRESFDNVKDFEDIMHIVDQNKVPWFGPLAIYDTAYRIGRKMKIEPEYVYLHAGVRVGCASFKISPDPKTKDQIKRDELPVELQELANQQTLAGVENFLCVYKDGKLKEDQNDGCHSSSEKTSKNKGGC
ncbi:MAG: hypothetical protein AB7H80_14870 [Candidatus Kapaibacterium sp.]